MRAIALALVLALVAACSFPTKHFTGGGDGGGGGDGPGATDARVADGAGADAASSFACAGQAFPTSAPPQIVLMGGVSNGTGGTVPNVMVTGTNTDTGNQFMNQLTDGSGAFNYQVSTNDQAINGYLMASIPGGPSSALYYPSQPFHASQSGIQLTMYDANTIQLIYQSVGLQWDGSSPTLFVQIVDCNGQPVAGAKLRPGPSAPPPQAIHYTTNNGLDPSATMTDSTGAAVAFNVPLNGGTYTAIGPGGLMFHTYSYTLYSRSVVTAIIQP